jgi:leukotriene-A4 hydrolase
LNEALGQNVDRPKYQRLVIDFEPGEDPDDAYSSIPYEKGSNFLLYLGVFVCCVHAMSEPYGCLEKTLGGLDVFLPYIRDYVETFQGKSITTWDWKSHLYAYFERHGGQEKLDALNSVDWDVSSRSFSHSFRRLIDLYQAWFYGEGLKLPVEPSYDTTLAEAAYSLAARWDASRSVSNVAELDFAASDVENYNSNQKRKVSNSFCFHKSSFYCSCIPRTPRDLHGLTPNSCKTPRGAV